jgi:hypothetical protein
MREMDDAQKDYNFHRKTFPGDARKARLHRRDETSSISGPLCSAESRERDYDLGRPLRDFVIA